MINFYSSPDCIHWEYMSNFKKREQANNTFWEYPELFPLTVKGSNETKWVLLVNESGADAEYAPTAKYFIGDFDGQSFKATQLDAKKFSYCWIMVKIFMQISLAAMNQIIEELLLVG